MTVPLNIRVQAVLCADDDGANAATITAGEFTQRVEAANTIYAATGITFVFDPATDLVQVHNTLLNRDFTALEPPDVGADGWSHAPATETLSHERARDDFARLYPRKIVVYCRQLTKVAQPDETVAVWKIVGKANFSSWASWHVNLSRSGAGLTTLAHEIGHYLQIRHTFVGFDTVEAAAAEIKKRVNDGTFSMADGLHALDADRVWVLDTPADCSPDIFDDAGVAHCGAEGVTIKVDFGQSSKEYLLKPDQLNLMSYHGCPGTKTISPQQRHRVRDGLEIGMRQRLVSLRSSGREALIAQKTGAAGLIGRYDVVALGYGRVVTPVSDGNNDLKVIAWDISATGEIVRRGDAMAGAVDGIRACAIGLGMLVTAVRTASGALKLIVWKVDSAGNVTRKGSATGGQVSEIAVCRLGIEEVATATRKMDGTLGVDVWRVTASGDISHAAEASAGTIQYTPPSIGLHPVGPYGFATSVRDADQKLVTILWKWDAKAGTVVRKEKISYNDTGMYVTACALDGELAVTAARVADTTLKLYAQSFSGDGEHATARATATAGKVETPAMCRVGVEHVVTGVSIEGSRATLIAWNVGASGAQIIRRDSVVINDVQHVRLCQTGTYQFLVAARTSSQNLALSTWELRAPFKLPQDIDMTLSLQNMLTEPLRRLVIDADKLAACEVAALHA